MPRSSRREHPVGDPLLYESPALIGCALAVSRRLYDQLWGFDPHMRSWGVEDLDFGLKAWLAGHPILHDPAAVVGHRFRQSFDNFTVPTEHLWANQLRMARKQFTEATWSQWVQHFRRQHERCGCHGSAPTSPEARLALWEHPEGPWARAWETFLADRASVEQERSSLHSRRLHDEFWYAERFGLGWPRLEGTTSSARHTTQKNSSQRAAATHTVHGTDSGGLASGHALQSSSSVANPSSAPAPSPCPTPSPSPLPSPSPPPPPCPISLLEGFGVGWEGGDLDFYLSAESTAGDISTYRVDINNDGTFEGSGSHDSRINGALITGLSGNLTRTPMDDGPFSAAVRITDTADNSCDFSVRIDVGNVPPAIEIVADTQGETTADFQMTVSILEPGDDTVQTLSIHWGDGATSALPAAGGTATHRYAADGEYTATVTVTDEDGTWSRDHALNIGDQNAPPLPETFPQIVDASATIDPSSQSATLTIVAVDAFGNPVPQIRWDLSGGDLFLDGTGPTIVIPPDNTSAVPYFAAVQFTDGTGNTDEALFAFAASGSPETKATRNNARDRFKKETPDLPDDWDVHHTKQDALAARYLRERGINVHESQYLRGVPRDVHGKFITPLQNAWWDQKADILGVTRAEAFNLVSWAEIDEFEAALDREFSDFFLSPGPRQKARIDEIRNIVNKRLSQLVMDKSNRYVRVGIVITGSAFFALLAVRGANACENIRNHTPVQKGAWDTLIDAYTTALDKARRRVFRKSDAHLLKEKLVEYMNALGLDDDAVNKVNLAISAAIDLSDEIPD